MNIRFQWYSVWAVAQSSFTITRCLLQSKDDALLDMLIEEERERCEKSQQMALEEEQRSRQQRRKQRDDLIDDLVGSFVLLITL